MTFVSRCTRPAHTPASRIVWSVKFMLSGVSQQTIPQGFLAGQSVRLPGYIMAKVVDGKIVRLRERM